MKLSLGLLLFYWDKWQIFDFYVEMVGQLFDVIYFGEIVCVKCWVLFLNDWQVLVCELVQVICVELVFFGLVLIEVVLELFSLCWLCENGEFWVEVNDMVVVYYFSQCGVFFVGGLVLNFYNGYVLVELYFWGMCCWILLVEVFGKLLCGVFDQVVQLGLE